MMASIDSINRVLAVFGVVHRVYNHALHLQRRGLSVSHDMLLDVGVKHNVLVDGTPLPDALYQWLEEWGAFGHPENSFDCLRFSIDYQTRHTTIWAHLFGRLIKSIFDGGCEFLEDVEK